MQKPNEQQQRLSSWAINYLTSFLVSAFVDFFNPVRQDWVVMICLNVHHGANNESVEVLCRPEKSKKILAKLQLFYFYTYLIFVTKATRILV